MPPLEVQGLGLVGCGFMGKALVKGWLASGIPAARIFIQDPRPSDWLLSQSGLNVNLDLPRDLSAIVIATKPQSLKDVLPALAPFGGGNTIIISIAAGAPISLFETYLGEATPIARVMPNLPAEVGAAVTALFANAVANTEHVHTVRHLFETVGTVVTLPSEDLLHAVTDVSGSGPAYVFAMTEALAHAGTSLGIPPDLARMLALQTIVGAGAMLKREGADATTLREAVTSYGGTTAAGLEKLQGYGALNALIKQSVEAATQRSVELAAFPGRRCISK